MLFGVDISHWDGTVDFGALKAAGCDFVGIKCSQSGVFDPMWSTYTKQAIAVQMPFFGYPFLQGNDTTNMMQDTFSALADVGATIALDWEATGVPASIVEAWMNMYESKANRAGLAYYGEYPPAPASPKIGAWPRWFPEYNSTSRIPPAQTLLTQDWRNAYLIWQYSATGAIHGINGNTDFNHSAPILTLAQFTCWLKTGSFVGAIEPTPVTPVVVPPPAPVGPVNSWSPTSIKQWQVFFGREATGQADLVLCYDIGQWYHNNPDSSRKS